LKPWKAPPKKLWKQLLKLWKKRPKLKSSLRLKIPKIKKKMHNSDLHDKKAAEPLSVRRPFLFGLLLTLGAVVLIAGVVGVLSLLDKGKGNASLFGAEAGLGMVRIEGAIMDPEPVVNWIRVLRRDESIKGVLLRINSPGGAVAPSQEMYSAVKRLAEEKPVVVSMGSVAASGGYYAAAPADLIVANPSTITGSIGVRMQLANLEELFGKIGIKQFALTTGKFKDAGSPFKPLTVEDRAYLESVIQDMHEQFVADVAEGRGMLLEDVRPLADGRIFTGNAAFDVGLVDELGDLEEAFEKLKVLSGLSVYQEYKLLDGPPSERGFLRDLLGETSVDVKLELPDASRPVFQ
jgi:protease-4